MSKSNPLKHRATNGKIKAEVKEKVREIRLRQQNWMKQRDEQQQRVTSTAPTSTSSGPATNKLPVSSSNAYYGTPSKQSNNKQYSEEDSTRPKGQFKNWLQARGATFDKDDNERRKSERPKNTPQLDTGNKSLILKKGVISNETVHHADGRETNLLRLNSSRSVESATPDPEWSKDQVLGSSSSRSEQPSYHGFGSPRNEITQINGNASPDSSYNPNQYETLADEIISRVKQTLDLKADKGELHQGIHDGSTHQSDCDGNVHASETSPISHMSSHHCPICRQLMLAPNHEAMLVIPCGHTVCDGCIKGRSLCPACQSPVSSCMGNLMLQQIIEGFQQQRLVKERQLRKSNPPIQSYQPLFYSEKDVDYTELYSNLKTRHEILLQESSNLHKQVHECTEKIHKQSKQVENIEREETNLSNEIAELTSRLHDLRGHKSEYEVKVRELGQKKDEIGRQLRLTEDTLSNVKNQMEKIELLQDGS